MSYAPLPQDSTTKLPLEQDEDLLSSLNDIPSHFDLALNGGANRTFLSPNAQKTPDASLLDPEAFRRLSVSTISSMGRARSISPYPNSHLNEKKTWRSSLNSFWETNQPLFLVALSQLFGALMNATTRVLELEGDGMHPFQILFARQGLTALFCTAWMWWKKVDGFPLGNKGVRGLLVARAFTGFFGIFGMYYSLQYLPVADAVVITFLAPSVASYGCYLVFKEPFPRSAQYASLISLLGVVLIARPFAPSHPTSSSSPYTTNSTIAGIDVTPESSYPTPTSAQRLSAVAVAMLGVLGSAGAFTSIRYIGSRAHPLLSVNYFSTFCLVISTLALSLSKPLGISDLGFVLPNGIRQWSMLLFLGVCGFVMQYLLTRGLGGGRDGRKGGARATNMIYTNMLFALALDKVVFGQSPGWWSLGGSGLILGSAVFVAVQKQKGDGVSGGNETRDRNVGEGVGDEEMAMLGLRETDEEAERTTQNVGENGALRDELSDLPPPRAV